MAGQMSLFDFVGEEEKKGFEVSMPEVEEYEKEQHKLVSVSAKTVKGSGFNKVFYRSLIDLFS